MHVSETFFIYKDYWTKDTIFTEDYWYQGTYSKDGRLTYSPDTPTMFRWA